LVDFTAQSYKRQREHGSETHLLYQAVVPKYIEHIYHLKMPTARVATSAVHTADRLLAKKDEFKRDINLLDANNKMCASILARDGGIESAVRRALEQDDPAAWNNFAGFLNEQREKVKGFTESHIALNRKAHSFVGAVQAVKQDMISRQNNPEDDSPAADYEVALQTKMEMLQQQAESRAGPIAQEPMMIRIKENLGEPTANDDDDIQVEMPNQDSSNQYKCPVTQRLIENPVRNKVCGHVYDLAGFRFWMRGHQTRKCPISGCTNATACESQLEEDVEFQMKLRRFVKRGEQERQNRMNQSQSQNLDQSFEEMDQPNFTVLE
jgi:hypothetical protein